MVKRNRASGRTLQDDVLATQICELKKGHPFWGYRRIWAWLRYREKRQINQKLVYRVMKERGLLCPKRLKRTLAQREPKSKPKAVRPRELWGTDMTKIRLKDGSWAYIVIVLDWFSKKLVGLEVSGRSRSEDWLKALDEAANTEFFEGIKGKGIRLVSDNGCQPTSNAFHNYCCETGIEQVFTSYNNPKGNAETERMMRTMKEELLWLKDWKNLEEVKEALRAWQKEYNKNYLHSSIGYRSPEEAHAMLVGEAA
jgi:putative transposase